MSTLTNPTGTDTQPVERRARWPRVACAAAALGTAAPFALSQLTGDTGAEITAGLGDDATALMSGSIIAVLVAAGLFLAAVRLGRAVGGDGGVLVTAAGSAVALMYAGYYAVFGAGGIVAGQMLEDPGPGLGEATSLMLNVMEVTRYAPGLALVATVLVAGRHLPRWVRISAGVLVVMCLVPLTSWGAALVIPLWLGAVAAASR